MGKKIKWDEYCIRSLAFYHDKGGVFNELITVLTKLRKVERGMPQITSILNEACYRVALIQNSLLEDEIIRYCKDDRPYMNYTVAALLKQIIPISQNVAYAIAILDKQDDKFYPAFKHLFEKKEVKKFEATEAEQQYLNRIQDLEDEIKAKESLLADALDENDTLKRTVESLKTKKESKLDKSFTFLSTIEYVKKLKQYQYCNQILEMLKDQCAMVGAQEEYKLVMRVKQLMLDASVPTIYNHNDIHNSNVFPGMVNNPTFPIQENVEVLIKRVLEEYTKKLNNGKE